MGTRTHEPVFEVSFTPAELAALGDGQVAYIKQMKSEDVQRVFPQVPHIQPGLDLFALVSADGTPIMLSDTKEAALLNAWEKELQMMSLH